MEAHRRKSHHELAPRLTSSEGDPIPDLAERTTQRRMSLGQVSDHGLDNLSELISTMDTSYYPPNRRSSLNAQIKPVTSTSRKTSVKVRALSRVRVVFFKESFYEIYGYLGIVMLLAFTLSFIAMLYMTVVQVIPNWTANFLMNTDTLDNGEFLLLSNPSHTIVVTSTLMFPVFACLYLWLTVFMLSYNSETTVNNLAQAPDPNSLSYRLTQKLLPFLKRLQAQTGGVPNERTASIATATPSRIRSFESIKNFSAKIQRTSSFGSHTASRLIFDFTSMEGTYHRYYDALLDFPKLIFQTMSLTTYLTKGFPLPIIVFYVLPLGFNWLVSFYRFQRSKPDPMLNVARGFYLFDLFFAVFAPIVMLLYSYYNFHLDRENFTIREETLTPGSFDRIARLFADPIEVQLVKTSFANLQITEEEYILVKCFLNLLGIYKWKKSLHTSYLPTEVDGVIKALKHVHIIRIQAISISTSIENCAPYHHCEVYSYHWDWEHKSTCRCIVFMDVELAPKTYNEWINAPDLTEAMQELASNGHLQTVQIINRTLPELPEELRLCTKLKELILIYTKTRKFPDWMKEFTHLTHVENDFLHSSLQYLPSDIFTDMQDLRFVRTGGAAGLTAYPSLFGLHKLSTLAMSIVRGLIELPNLDDLSGLPTLYIADAIQVPRLPNLTGLTNLKNFAIFRRNEICCNGWATGYCDLTNFQCLPRASESTVQCVSDRISMEDPAVIDRVDGFMCGKNITQDLEASEPSLESTDGVCQGVLYRECYMNGTRGICYNGRMQVVHCDVFGEYEKMRRLQIARGAGDPCDPEEEEWLGCGES